MTQRNKGEATAAARVARHRSKLKRQGLKEVRIWINPDDEPAVRAYDARKTTGQEKKSSA